ncbi:sugar kinase [Virgibacillus salexigens]|uniref:sugar kinase n=1 Tax=Virgibacillus TaxID=84406 RepID=UPI001371D4B5|nr:MULTISPECIES: sugar kinase [Virgibacillus]MYL43207.1 sugar kinase [Virgibacillus massiliensis]
MDVVAIGETMVSLTPEKAGLMRHADSFIPKVAGAETNTLIGLSRLGHSTGWISRLGEDELGAMVLKEVKGEGVDTSYVELDASISTGMFFKEIVNDSDVRVYYYRKDSAATKMNPEILNREYITKAKYLFISGITPAISSTCCDTIFQAINIAKDNGVCVVFDPNIRRKLWSEKEAKETLLRLIKRSDIILPGKSEGAFLFGTEDSEQISNGCMQLGAKLTVVKLGEEGAYFQSLEEKGYVPGFPISRVVDPVGAGDGFTAGLLSGLLDGLSSRDAVERACITGAIATTVTGDYEGLPDRKLLKEIQRNDKREDVNR